MASLDQLYREKERYITFKSNVQSLIPSLSTSEQQIKDAYINIINSYKIDEEQADKQQIYQIANKITENKNTISSSIIPSIDTKIKEIDKEIADEIERERIERIKKEMERLSMM